MKDLKLPIIPWKGLGGFELYTHISEYYDILSEVKKVKVFANFFIRYELDDEIELSFNILNGKLYKITALKNYQGKVFGDIKIGMPIEKAVEIEPSLQYDDFEEVYYSDKGVYIETDPEKNTVMWISVYIKEIDDDNFKKGNW